MQTTDQSPKSTETLLPSPGVFAQSLKSTETLIAKPEIFTQRELQVMKSHLTFCLSSLEDHLYHLRLHSRDLWSKCNPEDQSSSEDYQELNNTRDSIRKTRVRRKNLAVLQKKIKDQLRK